MKIYVCVVLKGNDRWYAVKTCHGIIYFIHFSINVICKYVLIFTLSFNINVVFFYNNSKDITAWFLNMYSNVISVHYNSKGEEFKKYMIGRVWKCNLLCTVFLWYLLYGDYSIIKCNTEQQCCLIILTFIDYYVHEEDCMHNMYVFLNTFNICTAGICYSPYLYYHR